MEAQIQIEPRCWQGTFGYGATPQHVAIILTACTIAFQEIWGPVKASLTSVPTALKSITEDPTAWELWSRTGGGVAGERLMQLLQAMFRLTASASDFNASRICDKDSGIGMSGSIYLLIVALYRLYLASKPPHIWRHLSSWLISPGTLASILHAATLVQGICVRDAQCSTFVQEDHGGVMMNVPFLMVNDFFPPDLSKARSFTDSENAIGMSFQQEMPTRHIVPKESTTYL